MSTPTTTVEFTIRLTVDGTPEESRARLDALMNLADVMVVQAEDGLYTLGSPEAENDEGPSEFVAPITRTTLASITVDGQLAYPA